MHPPTCTLPEKKRIDPIYTKANDETWIENEKDTSETWVAKLFPPKDPRWRKRNQDRVYVQKTHNDSQPTHASEELTAHQIHAREKLVAMGKNTTGYAKYRALVPKTRRHRLDDPATPEATSKISKRRWQGKLCKWRRELHDFDALKVDEILLKKTREIIQKEMSLLPSLKDATITTVIHDEEKTKEPQEVSHNEEVPRLEILKKETDAQPEILKDDSKECNEAQVSVC
jgi:hypothetical protein